MPIGPSTSTLAGQTELPGDHYTHVNAGKGAGLREALAQVPHAVDEEAEEQK